MSAFGWGVLVGALGGFVVGCGATYLVFGWWVTRLLRGIADDTRRLLDRSSPRSADRS